MKQTKILFITTILFLLSLTTFCQITNVDLLISFEEGTTTQEIDQIRNTYQATTISISPLSQIHLWEVPIDPNSDDPIMSDINGVVADGKSRAKVRSIGLNLSTTFDPSDGMANNNCYNFTTCSADSTSTIKIAVLDTGIAYDVLGNFAAPIFDTYHEMGYVGYDFVNDDYTPEDDHGHGTHIAGIIAQVQSASYTTYGLSTANRPVSILSYKTHNSSGAGKISDIILATDEAVLNGAGIINMSFSYKANPPSIKKEPLEEAIDIAGNHGVLVVAAAGNDSNDNDDFIISLPNYPASFECDNIISVASLSCMNSLSWFSNWGGMSCDIAAPGEGISSFDLTGKEVTKDGTSQATALVSGIAGVLAAHLASPHWDPIKCSILNSAAFLPALASKVFTEGQLDPIAAQLELQNICGTSFRNSRPTENNNEANLADANPTEVSISPNPFDNILNISYHTNQISPIRIDLYDTFGKLIFTKAHESYQGEHTISIDDFPNLASGIYFIKISVGTEFFTKKLVKA